MIASISSLSIYGDPDYERIIRELLALGLSPSGNKSVDASTLAIAKQQKTQNNNVQNNVLIMDNKSQTDNTEMNKMEEEKTGASILGNINKIILGI